MALGMESRCLEFYRDAARRNQDAGGKEIFERMVREEESHVADLNSKLAEIVGQEKDLEHAPLFLHFDPCELEEMIPDLARFEGTDGLRLDAQASAELVLSLERSLAEFFKTFADKFADTQGKQILAGFANQETVHSDIIRQRLQETLGSTNAV